MRMSFVDKENAVTHEKKQQQRAEVMAGDLKKASSKNNMFRTQTRTK